MDKCAVQDKGQLAGFQYLFPTSSFPPYHPAVRVVVCLSTPVTIWFLLKITFIFHMYLQKILVGHFSWQIVWQVIFWYISTVDEEDAKK